MSGKDCPLQEEMLLSQIFTNVSTYGMEANHGQSHLVCAYICEVGSNVYFTFHVFGCRASDKNPVFVNPASQVSPPR